MTRDIPRGIDADMLERAVAECAARSAERGWDQPALLWRVDAQRVSVVGELHGDVADALVGVRVEADAVVVVCEGWVRDARPASVSADVLDAGEVRLAHGVGRDVELLRVEARSGASWPVAQPAGRVCEATRRVLGVPSKAVAPPLGDVRARAVTFAAVQAARVLGVERVLEQPPEALLVACWPVGLDQPGWDEARDAALARYEAHLARARGVERDATREAVEFLQWADGAMWGCRLDAGIPLLGELEALGGHAAVLRHAQAAALCANTGGRHDPGHASPLPHQT